MKACLFPYDSSLDFMIAEIAQMAGLRIDEVVCFRGWIKYKNKFLTEKNISVTCDFEEALKTHDIIIFAEGQIRVSFEKHIRERLEKAVEAGKKILYFRTSDETELEYVRNLEKKEQILIPSRKSKEFFEENELYEINTPIVFVSGLVENLNKNTTIIDIKNEMRNRQYSVKVVLTRQGAEMFGEYSIPLEMFDPTISEKSKIILFNHFIKEIESIEKPDLIIIGIPGEIVPISRKVIGFMGIMAFEITTAVTPDVVIMNVPYMENIKEIIASYRLKHIFKTEKFLWNVVDKYIDGTESEYIGELVLVSLNYEYVWNKIKDYSNKELFCLGNGDDSERICDRIEEILSDEETFLI